MRVHTPLLPGWCLLFSYVLSQLSCFTLWHRNYKKCAMLHSIILIIDWWGVQCVWWVQSLIYYDCHRCIVCNTMSWLTIKKRNRPRFSSANTSYALQKGVATSKIAPIEFLRFSLFLVKTFPIILPCSRSFHFKVHWTFRFQHTHFPFWLHVSWIRQC